MVVKRQFFLWALYTNILRFVYINFLSHIFIFGIFFLFSLYPINSKKITMEYQITRFFMISSSAIFSLIFSQNHSNILDFKLKKRQHWQHHNTWLFKRSSSTFFSLFFSQSHPNIIKYNPSFFCDKSFLRIFHHRKSV